MDRSGDRRAEVLVVGAGLSGLGVARALARRGARVTVLDAVALTGPAGGAQAAETSAARAAEGLVSVETPEPYPRMAAALGAERTAALLDLARRNALGVAELCAAHPDAGRATGSCARADGTFARADGTFARADGTFARADGTFARADGTFALTTEPAELAELQEAARHADWEILADGAAVTRRTGATGFVGGVARPADLVVSPGRLLGLLEAEASAAGAVVTRGVRAREVCMRPDGVALRWDGGDATAELAVLCAGAALPALYPPLAPWIVPVPCQGMSLGGIVAPAAPRRSWSANFGHIRVAWDPAGGDEALRGWSIPWSLRRAEDLSAPCAIDPSFQDKIELYLRSHLPAVAGMRVVARRAARLAYTQDNLPLVGPLPGQSRVACCAGFSGHDWSLALAAAELLAAALAGEPRDPVLEILSPRRLMVS